MSDFFVKAISEELAQAGFPLSRQQVEALVTSRKKATAKGREEVRNAVRGQILSEGMSREAIKKHIEGVINDEIVKFLKGDAVEMLVRNEVNRRIASIIGDNDAFKRLAGSVIKTAVLGHIDANVRIDIGINAASHYQEGGTF